MTNPAAERGTPPKSPHPKKSPHGYSFEAWVTVASPYMRRTAIVGIPMLSMTAANILKGVMSVLLYSGHDIPIRSLSINHERKLSVFVKDSLLIFSPPLFHVFAPYQRLLYVAGQRRPSRKRQARQ